MSTEQALAGAASEVPAAWLAGALDELDYAVLLIDGQRRVHHVNRQAEIRLAEGCLLTRRGAWIDTVDPAHGAPLFAAIDAAARLGVRRMLTLRAGDSRTSIAVVPLRAGAGAGAMLVLGREAPCMDLTAHGYANSCKLSHAETVVLSALIDGDDPPRIARTNRVSLSTVRTQIISIRSKTGSASIRSLIRELAMLPPLVSVLGVGGAARS